ncbi:MAG TPA: calcium-binding protein, partial [Geminicoccus sp.]|nr:calcium-binding protein [Geminicoccus sp.]
FADGDSFNGIEGVIGSIFGDTLAGSDDVNALFGGDGDDSVFGDAANLEGAGTTGGDDVIDGGAGNDVLRGEGFQLNDGALGGDDTIVGGAGDDTIFGDSGGLFGGIGGSDTLRGGDGNDTLFGDSQFRTGGTTGADRFVFAPGDDDDEIGDFRSSDNDKIDVRAYGYTSFASLDSNGGGLNGTETHVTQVNGSLIIDLSGAAGGTPGADTVTVNVATLAAGDFIL